MDSIINVNSQQEIKSIKLILAINIPITIAITDTN